PALLRQARGDALDDPRASSASRACAQAADRPDPDGGVSPGERRPPQTRPCCAVDRALSASTSTRPTPPPSSCAPRYPGTDAGAIPAKVWVNIRPTVMAGFAKLVELVKK